MSETKVNSSLFSKFKKTQVNNVQKLPDITGLTIDKFHVDSRLDIVSGEADIYLCSRVNDKSGKSFLLKYYRRENAVKPDVIEKLKAVNSLYVAKVEGFGEYEGHQYVVRPYYEMSALSELLAEGTRFSEEDLRNLIIPSIIEALKAVHDAGILHKDLKPANMIPDDKGERIVLIDFGISSDAGKNTFVVTQTGMTPFYAAPEAMQGIFHRETDYYALGITVFELFTGFTPFQNPELSPEDVARLATVNKIEFPDNFPENLKKLVLGLTYKDISHRNEKGNSNRRWGYDEVKRWLKGEEVPVPGESVGAVNTAGAIPVVFHPYRFCGKTYTSETELLRTMLRRPEDALKDLGRGFLSHHYYAFSEKKGKLCRDAETKLGNNASKNLSLMVALIYRLSPAIRDIPYNGGILGSIQDLGRVFVDAGLREASENGSLRGKNTALTQPVRDFVLSGIPEDYAAIVLNNTSLSRLFENTRKLWNSEKCPDSDTELTLILGWSLCDDRRLPVHGRVYDSPESFLREMKQLAEKDRKAYTEFTEVAREDLDFLENRFPDTEVREIMAKALEDAKWAVFGDNEYLFRNSQEFEDLIKRLVQEEKTYELQSLWNRYRKPLKSVSEKIWNTSSRADLDKIVSGFIRIGEYLFTGENSFREFMTGVVSRGKKEPAFLLGFIKVHRGSLDRAAEEFPSIADAVSDIYAAGNAVIVLDEHLFFGPDEFRCFIESVIDRGNVDPGYLVGFVNRHRVALERLNKDDSIRKITGSLEDSFKSLIIFDGRIFTTVLDFEAHIDDIIQKGKNDLRYLVAFTETHRQEISDLCKRDGRCREALRRLRNVRNRIVVLDEYVFPTVSEFGSFLEEILKKGQEDPAYLRRFTSVHGKALAELVGVNSLSPIIMPLIDAGKSVIELDEYAFPNAGSFERFASELSGGDRGAVLRISGFAGEHMEGLKALESNTAVSSLAKELINSEAKREKEEAISVNGIKFLSIVNGDFIKFGRYQQKENGDKEPIEWLVLDTDGDEALLVSRYALHWRGYSTYSWNKTDWEESDLRKWLNEDFLKAAFSEDEIERVKVSMLKNDDNPKYGTPGGKSTKDRVFCLSIAEAEQYFENDEERRCQCTEYVRHHDKERAILEVRERYSKMRYCFREEQKEIERIRSEIGIGCYRWWLRSLGEADYAVAIVDLDGTLKMDGWCSTCKGVYVRPAIRIIF